VSVSQAIGERIPNLRRFARALTGNQESGDAYVVAALEAVAADPALIATERDVKLGLYRVFLNVWDSVEVNRKATPGDAADGLATAEHMLQTISPRPRQAFLLTAVEGLTPTEAAQVLAVSEAQCERLLEAADAEIAKRLACEVLIIEDEPLIALDVAELAKSMGHTVRHIARTHHEAIEAVAKHRPDLVLADIQLADGSSGLEAVQEILRSIDVPVIFITAHPERLLTGERPEPTYLLEKPFRPEAVKALISQALLFHKDHPRETVTPLAAN
jgi:CheY-like chemotaxis protein/DNA-directed RNA polymerase specialized sigma24 family protein